MERKGQRVEGVVIPLRKSEPRDINESQRRRKLAPSCISLMKIGWIAFTTDVSDGDTAILDPFTDGVLAMSDVTVPLCGQIMAPLHTCIIVVVEWCSYEGVVGRVPKQGKMKNHIANVDCKTGSHVSGMDLDIHELREVRSLCSVFQVIGPPDLKMMAPLILQNLNSDSWIPSLMVLPVCEPQQASLYFVRWWG